MGSTSLVTLRGLLVRDGSHAVGSAMFGGNSDYDYNRNGLVSVAGCQNLRVWCVKSTGHYEYVLPKRVIAPRAPTPVQYGTCLRYLAD